MKKNTTYVQGFFNNHKTVNELWFAGMSPFFTESNAKGQAANMAKHGGKAVEVIKVTRAEAFAKEATASEGSHEGKASAGASAGEPAAQGAGEPAAQGASAGASEPVAPVDAEAADAKAKHVKELTDALKEATATAKELEVKRAALPEGAHPNTVRAADKNVAKALAEVERLNAELEAAVLQMGA